MCLFVFKQDYREITDDYIDGKNGKKPDMIWYVPGKGADPGFLTIF